MDQFDTTLLRSLRNDDIRQVLKTILQAERAQEAGNSRVINATLIRDRLGIGESEFRCAVQVLSTSNIMLCNNSRTLLAVDPRASAAWAAYCR